VEITGSVCLAWTLNASESKCIVGLRTPGAFGRRRREAETGQDQLGDQVGHFLVGWAWLQTLKKDAWLYYYVV